MAENTHERPPIERPELQRLFVNWLIYLLDEHYGVSSRGTSGASCWSVTLADESTIQVEFGHSDQPEVQGPAKYDDALASIVEDAYRRTLTLDYGTGAWWRVSFSTDMGMTGITLLHFMRLMNEHNSRRFQGDWRLGGEALVSFQQANVESTPVTIPKFDVHITFRAPGPGPGPFAEEIAQEMGTFVRAATSFATAAPLLGSPPLFPASDVEVAETTAKLPNAPELPGDTVEGLPLWPQIMALVQGVDSPEAARRVQGAMFAYEQAMRQESEYVSIALLVSALEALCVPNTKWRLDRVATRFFRFVQELCPDALRAVMNHGNFAEVFGSYTSARRFLDTLYSLRSTPLHTGFLQHQLSAIPMGGPSGSRVMLVSELVRAGIVEFLRRPFSSLIGHPDIAPPSCSS